MFPNVDTFLRIPFHTSVPKMATLDKKLWSLGCSKEKNKICPKNLKGPDPRYIVEVPINGIKRGAFFKPINHTNFKHFQKL